MKRLLRLVEQNELLCYRLNDADIDHSDDQATKAGWIQASLEKIKSTPFALEPKHLTH
ncbi:MULTISPECIES: hypothetical protein [Acinetobacter]|uniref:Uncharacterized protein n=1 Tax=Acinetobacter geminorum TaxID=2730922 RepID=A0ABT8ZEB3_9GAMM|nr:MULTISPECIES: hypothetical protein [Acinetobacter]MBJ8501816.1 hypothetical protein [Acinetobacter pittii]MBJ9892249.1 hypothetical protein [Acinetobacter pittii]MCU4480036.1 hypothetical protein [Acinetobacter sp. WU_MDCI_Abxd143]MDO7363056.1 hypothetical protein [Acinetobacter geminorum]